MAICRSRDIGLLPTVSPTDLQMPQTAVQRNKESNAIHHLMCWIEHGQIDNYVTQQTSFAQPQTCPGDQHAKERFGEAQTRAHQSLCCYQRRKIDSCFDMLDDPITWNGTRIYGL